jgi:hypothetical protein
MKIEIFSSGSLQRGNFQIPKSITVIVARNPLEALKQFAKINKIEGQENEIEIYSDKCMKLNGFLYYTDKEIADSNFADSIRTALGSKILSIKEGDDRRTSFILEYNDE